MEIFFESESVNYSMKVNGHFCLMSSPFSNCFIKTKLILVKQNR